MRRRTQDWLYLSFMSLVLLALAVAWVKKLLFAQGFDGKDLMLALGTFLVGMEVGRSATAMFGSQTSDDAQANRSAKRLEATRNSLDEAAQGHAHVLTHALDGRRWRILAALISPAVLFVLVHIISVWIRDIEWQASDWYRLVIEVLVGAAFSAVAWYRAAKLLGRRLRL